MKQKNSNSAEFIYWVGKKLRRPFENLNRSIRKRIIRRRLKHSLVPEELPANHERIRQVILEALENTKSLEPALQQYSSKHISQLRACGVDHSRSLSYCVMKKWILSLQHSYEHIIFVPWLRYGGADLVAVHALRAAQQRHGVEGVLLVVTDSDKVSAKHWLPEGTHMTILSDFEPYLSDTDRISFVKNLIHSLQPKAVLNVNSRACWNVFNRYGVPLSHRTNLYAMLFCYDYTPDGRLDGYATEFFRDCLPSLTAIYSDNSSFWKELSRQYGVSSHYFKKFVTLYQPTVFPPPLPGDRQVFPAPPKDNQFRVFWAGRICRQKNPLLLLQIARLRPEFVFDVYGVIEDELNATLTTQLPPNVCLKGPFSSFESIPAASYNAYLYTSLWDGLPNVLIQAGMMNTVIVASGLESIVELIDDTTGWPVKALDSAEAYAKALDQIAKDPAGAARKAENLRSRIAERHSWETYMESFSKGPSFLD